MENQVKSHQVILKERDLQLKKSLLWKLPKVSLRMFYTKLWKRKINHLIYCYNIWNLLYISSLNKCLLWTVDWMIISLEDNSCIFRDQISRTKLIVKPTQGRLVITWFSYHKWPVISAFLPIAPNCVKTMKVLVVLTKKLVIVIVALIWNKNSGAGDIYIGK